MPGLDGIAVAEESRTELPHCKSLIVASRGRAGHLRRALTDRAGGVRYVDLQLAAEAISAGDSPLTRMATGYRGAACGVAR